MKIHLASLALVLSLTDAFTIPKEGTKATLRLNAEVNSMWAFDVYGRDNGELPSLEVMYVEGDPWYYDSRSGIGQRDFYPMVRTIEMIKTQKLLCLALLSSL